MDAARSLTLQERGTGRSRGCGIEEGTSDCFPLGNLGLIRLCRDALSARARRFIWLGRSQLGGSPDSGFPLSDALGRLRDRLDHTLDSTLCFLA